MGRAASEGRGCNSDGVPNVGGQGCAKKCNIIVMPVNFNFIPTYSGSESFMFFILFNAKDHESHLLV